MNTNVEITNETKETNETEIEIEIEIEIHEKE